MGVCEEGARVQDCAIAAQGRGQVDFVLEAGAGCGISGVRSGVDGEREGLVDLAGDMWFQDEGNVWVGGMDVVRVFVEGFVDDGATALSDE